MLLPITTALSDYYDEWQTNAGLVSITPNIEFISVVQASAAYFSLSWEESRVCESEPFCSKIKRQKHEIDDRTPKPAVHQYIYPEKKGNSFLLPSKFTTSGTSNYACIDHKSFDTVKIPSLFRYNQHISSWLTSRYLSMGLVTQFCTTTAVQ